MMKNKKIIIGIIITIVIAVICASIYSIYKFKVFNPFSSCIGMLQILFTDKQYTIVQNYPYKVIFAKCEEVGEHKLPGELLDEYMKERGFEKLEDEQMGAMIVYSNGNIKERVLFSVNAYYSKWVWED